MTFRIFQVSTDGVASPVYSDTDPRRSDTTTSKPPAEGESSEWRALRERLTQQPAPRPTRKTWLGR